MGVIKRNLWAITPQRVRDKFYPQFAHCSYSQEGEDRVLSYLLDAENSRPGFFVDVGAHHPQRFSNTYAFYLNGWRGINIDAAPHAMQPFNRLRPRDINVNAAIGDEATTVTYYEFNEPAVNTCCKEVALRSARKPHLRIVRTTEIETVTLAEVFDKHLPPGQLIDFMTIDVEGHDEQVLRSNDWTRYRPRIVLAEALGFSSVAQIADTSLAQFMDVQGYDLVSKTVQTLFFQQR